MSERAAWFDCFSGIAGDMALGALVDAGVDPQNLIAALGTLDLPGWSLTFEPVLRAGIGATQAVVEVTDTTTSRHYTEIVSMIQASGIPDRAKARAVATFTALGRAEAMIHRVALDDVHFHEVGAVDSIIDVVGVCVALELAEIDQVAASAVATGTGIIKAAHGVLPNPAPAVAELLRGLPVTGSDREVELTTPTGAALLKALGESFGSVPAMTVERVGRGAGTRDPAGVPNIVQVLIGARTADADSVEGQPMLLLETNLDDVSGETMADGARVALEAGAVDAWITPILGKKGRPAYLLSSLVDASTAGRVASRIRAETGTLGVRTSPTRRWAAPRVMETVEVAGQPIRVKVGPEGAKAEHDDCQRAAEVLGLPVREVAGMAIAAFRQVSG